MSERDPLRIAGQTIADKYRIEEAVGEGGFAVVYRALHTIWKQPVAIKFFNGLSTAPVDQRDQLQQDFINEGALLSELSSHTANIVQARDVGSYTTPDGQWMPYMVLEWLEGESLEETLAREQNAGAAAWSLEEMCRRDRARSHSAGSGPQARHRAPRHQAGEPVHCRRRTAQRGRQAEGARLRRRQDDGRQHAAAGRAGENGHEHHVVHAAVRRPGTVHAQLRRHGPVDGRVRAGAGGGRDARRSPGARRRRPGAARLLVEQSRAAAHSTRARCRHPRRGGSRVLQRRWRPARPLATRARERSGRRWSRRREARASRFRACRPRTRHRSKAGPRSCPPRSSATAPRQSPRRPCRRARCPPCRWQEASARRPHRRCHPPSPGRPSAGAAA